MTVPPLISIVTPTYNRAEFLQETIESTLSQDYSNIEHLIIDDGSTDNTKELVEKYQDTGKIRYFYQKNSGQNIARNLGVEKAKGEFICFLDSDDKFLPNKLRLSVQAFLEHPQVDVVYGDYIFINEKGHELAEKNMRRYSGNITKHLLRDNCVSMNTTMVRTDAIIRAGGFSAHVKFADDYDLWLRLSVNSEFYYLPKRLSAYRLMDNQISSDTKARFKSNEEIITRFLEEHPYSTHEEEKRDALNFFYTRAARHFSKEKEFKLANHYLWQALNTSLFKARNFRIILRHTLNLASYIISKSIN